MEISSSYSIFDYISLQQSSMNQLSQNALGSAIDLYQAGEYKKAAKEFQRSISLSPYSENIIETYDYLANTYLKLDDPANAEKAYKTALKVDPQREDMYVKLGNLYYSNKKFTQAEKAYRNAIHVYSNAETNYSLAHCCLGVGKLIEAESLFKKVIGLEPRSANGYYGLGMTYAKKGEHENAIGQFQKALKIKPDFNDARVEMGYSQADLGDYNSAKENYEILNKKDDSLSSLLYAYIYKVENPKFKSANMGGFNWDLSIRTTIRALDNYFKNANETRYFTVRFSFTKDMDAKSVQDPENWQISAAEGSGPTAYNFGLKLSSNEVPIPDKPENILYDPSTRTAAVTFAITQNEQADGIMDPGHVQFTFSGTDKFGLKMDETCDSFCGFNGFA
jgi:tetratricopeptide (TPR) repeat protein